MKLDENLFDDFEYSEPDENLNEEENSESSTRINAQGRKRPTTYKSHRIKSKPISVQVYDGLNDLGYEVFANNAFNGYTISKVGEKNGDSVFIKDEKQFDKAIKFLSQLGVKYRITPGLRDTKRLVITLPEEDEDAAFDYFAESINKKHKCEVLKEATKYPNITNAQSQIIFNELLQRDITGEDLENYMYHFSIGMRAGINFNDLLRLLKDCPTADKFSERIYQTADPAKYAEIYGEALNRKLNKLKEDFFNLEKDKDIRKQQLQGIVDNAVKIFGRIPGGIVNDLDEVGYYAQEQEDGSWIVKDKKDIPVNESFEDEHGVVAIEVKAEPTDIPAQDPNNQDNGLIALVNSLIQDEFDAIQQYKDAIVNFANQGRNDLTQVLEDILNEENIHVGQLETLLKSLDSSAENIEQGKQEAQEQLNNELVLESLQQSDKEQIEEIAKGDFESGHIFAEDYEEFKSQLRGENIKVTEELYDYYVELKDLGPTGFYQAFKDKFDFDPDFVAEFGDEDDDEDDDFNENLDKKEETKKCSICGKEFIGYGNNAQPVNDGVCCDDCNMSEVIPARLKQMVKGDKK